MQNPRKKNFHTHQPTYPRVSQNVQWTDRELVEALMTVMLHWPNLRSKQIPIHVPNASMSDSRRSNREHSTQLLIDNREASMIARNLRENEERKMKPRTIHTQAKRVIPRDNSARTHLSFSTFCRTSRSVRNRLTRCSNSSSSSSCRET